MSSNDALRKLDGVPENAGPFAHEDQPAYWAVYLVGMIRAALKQPETSRVILETALTHFQRHAPPHLQKGKKA